MQDALIEYRTWRSSYKHTTTSVGISDIQLTAAIIYELHRIPAGETVQEEILIDSILNKYTTTENAIREMIWTLHVEGLLSMETTIHQNEPAYEIHKFAFDLRKVNDKFINPWHCN